MSIEQRIENLDVSLFDRIPTQTAEGDKLAWLVLQRSVRRRKAPYTYLEVGSYLGGSIQPHLLDTRCGRIYSIDKRVAIAPDDRALSTAYEGNTTARMLANLSDIAPQALDKLACFDADVRQLDPSRILEPPDLCLIDGEHTEEAVLSDFAFCRQVCAPSAVVCFHNDWVIHSALSRILSGLRRQRIAHRPLKLPGCTFAIALGDEAAAGQMDLLPWAVSGRRFLRHTELRRRLKSATPGFMLPAMRRLARAVRAMTTRSPH